MYVLNLSSLHSKNQKVQVHNYSNFGTGEFSILGHVTCPANFKRADYRSLAGVLSESQKRGSIYNVYAFSIYVFPKLSLFLKHTCSWGTHHSKK